METKKKWFTLREAHDDQRHIATVGVEIFADKETAIQQFNQKIEEALSEHFDEECKLARVLNPLDYMNSDPQEEAFTFAYDGEEPHKEEFEIEQTWLY